VLLASNTVFTALKYAGAAYLIYLGVQTLRGSGLSLPAGRASDRRESAWRVWTRAAALQASNPKSLIFFTALLPQFIDTSRPVAFQFFILGITSVVIEFGVLAGYGFLAARAARLTERPRFRTLTNRVSGALLIVAGAGVALNRTR
jgi:threonine/homoserine/homoserine lactone efflux protein